MGHILPPSPSQYYYYVPGKTGSCFPITWGTNPLWKGSPFRPVSHHPTKPPIGICCLRRAKQKRPCVYVFAERTREVRKKILSSMLYVLAQDEKCLSVFITRLKGLMVYVSPHKQWSVSDPDCELSLVLFYTEGNGARISIMAPVRYGEPLQCERNLENIYIYSHQWGCSWLEAGKAFPAERPRDCREKKKYILIMPAWYSQHRADVEALGWLQNRETNCKIITIGGNRFAAINYLSVHHRYQHQGLRT